MHGIRQGEEQLGKGEVVKLLFKLTSMYLYLLFTTVVQ